MTRCAVSPQQREQFPPAPGACVPLGHDRHRQRPFDRQIGIVVGDSKVFPGIVRPVDPVADVRGRRQSLEAVEESRRNVEVPELLVVEPERLLGPERRGIGPHIDQHIVDRAVGTSHELRLPGSGTSVHPPDNTTGRTRLGILNERCGRSRPAEVLVEDRGVERPGEQSAVVTGRLRYKNQDIGQVRLLDAHEEIVP